MGFVLIKGKGRVPDATLTEREFWVLTCEWSLPLMALNQGAGFHFDLQKSLNIYLQIVEVAVLKCFWMSVFKPKSKLNVSTCWIDKFLFKQHY